MAGSRIDTLQQNLLGNLAAVNAEKSDEPQAVFDPTLIVTIITSILSAIANCRKGTADGVQTVKSGSARVERLTRQRLIQEQYGTLREYRRQGGERVLKATLKTVQETPDDELQEAVAEQQGDLVDAGVSYEF